MISSLCAGRWHNAALRLMAAFLLALGGFSFGATGHARNADTGAARAAVQTKRVLFIGNSRLYYGDVPKLFRAVAQSAGLPYRYETKLHGVPNARLADHIGSPEVAKLLAQPWDIVVIQPAGGENFGTGSRASFLAAGAVLVEKAQHAAKRVILLKTWPYDDEGYSEAAGPAEARKVRGLHIGWMQADFEFLARKTGASVLDITSPWMRLRDKRPDLRLYDDETHPSPAGSYFAALVIFGYLEADALPKAAFTPKGVADADGKLMREIAMESAK